MLTFILQPYSRVNTENPYPILDLFPDLLMLTGLPREDQGVREVLPHIGPIPIIIPLKLFLEGIDFLTDNVTSRVAWKFRGGGKVQKHVGISL